jgi:adenine-specific DNA-methyltransferase
MQPLATTSMDSRPNLRYPLVHDDFEIWPEKQWFWSKERTLKAQKNNELVFTQKRGKWTVNYKQYLIGEDGTQRKSKPYSIITDIYTQSGTKAIKDIFGNGKAFDFPKPPAVIELLLQIATDKNSIVLDSFAGSGTTAHAVLNMNKADGGNRKFILVEMEDYAETITAERVRRVIEGYNDKEGTGGGFSYYELGDVLMYPNGRLNDDVGVARIREYVWFMETKMSLPSVESDNPYYLGATDGTAYYFHYEREQGTTLDGAFLARIDVKASHYVIYADRCALSDKELARYNITFKKIPRDIEKL